MSERAIFKLRVVKTDEGLRVEVKGDPKLLRELAQEQRRHHHQHRHEQRLWSRWERRFRHTGHHQNWWHDITET